MNSKNYKEFFELNDKDKKKYLYPYPKLILENEAEIAYLIKFLVGVARGDGKDQKDDAKIKTQADIEKTILDNLSGVSVYSAKMANAQSSNVSININPRKLSIGLVAESVGIGQLFYSFCGNAAMINYGKIMTTSFVYKEMGSVCFYSLAIQNFELFSKVLSVSGFTDSFAKLFVEKIESIKELYKIAEIDSNIKQIFFPVNNEYHILGIVNSSKLRFEISRHIRNRKNEITDEYITYGIKEIQYGGTKPLNSGEVMGFLGGRAETLKAFLPNAAIVNYKNNDYLFDLIEKTGDVFSAIKKKRIYYSEKGPKDDFNFIGIIEHYLNLPVNVENTKKIEKVCSYLLKDMLADVEKFVNENLIDINEYDPIFKNMKSSMKKFIAPHLFKGSIMADDYRYVQEKFLDSVTRNLYLKKDNEVYMLTDRTIDSFKKVSRKILEDF